MFTGTDKIFAREKKVLKLLLPQTIVLLQNLLLFMMQKMKVKLKENF